MAQELVVAQFILLLLVLHDRQGALGLLHVRLCCVVSVLSVLSFLNDLLLLLSSCLLAHLFYHLQLLAALLNGVRDFGRSLPGNVVDDLAFWLSDEHFSDLVLLDVVPRVVVDLLHQVVVH